MVATEYTVFLQEYMHLVRTNVTRHVCIQKIQSFAFFAMCEISYDGYDLLVADSTLITSSLSTRNGPAASRAPPSHLGDVCDLTSCHLSFHICFFCSLLLSRM